MKQIYVRLLVCIGTGSAVRSPVSFVVDIFRNNKMPTQASFNGKSNEDLLGIHNIIKRNFNPLDLPNIIVSVPFGKMKLTEVKLYGLDTMYHYNNASLTYDDTFLYPKVQFTFKNITIASNYVFNILILESKGTFIANIDDFVVSLSLRINRRTFKFNLLSFEVKNIGDIDIKLKGRKLTDSLLALVVNLLSTLFKDQSKAFVGPPLKGVLEDLVAEHSS